MASKIELLIICGKLKGTKFGIDERMTCIIGRAEDCNLQIPPDADDLISRHHCILDVNPPEIVIRDLGSSNGTFINGKSICTAIDSDNDGNTVTLRMPSEHILNHGDNIKLGDTVLVVSIKTPAYCSDCSDEISVTQLNVCRRKSGVLQCDSCYLKKQQEKLEEIKDHSQHSAQDKQSIKNISAGDTALILGNIKSQTVAIDLSHKTLHVHGYTLIRQLGRGGMGAVYLAEDEKTGKQVALKLMLPKTSVTQYSLDDFLREMDNTRALDHPNIVKLYDSGYSHGAFYFSMEYCNEGDICDLMKKRQATLELDEALGITMQILDGLEYAHNAEIPYVKLKTGSVHKGKGLIHRDLKPENIYIIREGGQGVAKLADFGLSKAFDLAGLSGCTRTGDAAGTPYFMSRSQLIDFKYSKPDIDVWSVAATLYFMLTNKYPRDFSSGKDPLTQILETSPVPILHRNINIPKKLADLIDFALDDSKQLHFKSAEEFKYAINDRLV